MSESPASREQRIDQWLWFSRLVKSRTLAQALIERGKVRVNRERIGKASLSVKPGDVLTLSMGPHVRIIAVVAIGARRGPAAEAAGLYRELEGGSVFRSPQRPPAEQNAAPVAPQGVRDDGAGRPTKRDRRQIERLRGKPAGV